MGAFLKEIAPKAVFRCHVVLNKGDPVIIDADADQDELLLDHPFEPRLLSQGSRSSRRFEPCETAAREI